MAEHTRDPITGYSRRLPVAADPLPPGGVHTEGLADAIILAPVDRPIGDALHTPTEAELIDLGRPVDPGDADDLS